MQNIQNIEFSFMQSAFFERINNDLIVRFYLSKNTAHSKDRTMIAIDACIQNKKLKWVIFHNVNCGSKRILNFPY